MENQVREIALVDLQGNKFNPNEMSKGLFDKLKANLKAHPTRYPFELHSDILC